MRKQTFREQSELTVNKLLACVRTFCDLAGLPPEQQGKIVDHVAATNSMESAGEFLAALRRILDADAGGIAAIRELINGPARNVTLVDPAGVRVRCDVCGTEWSPVLRPGGGELLAGWNRCPNGCNTIGDAQ